jgi:hypothetical protein
MALLEGNALADQPVQIGRVHMLVSQACDGVIPLLIRDNEDDIGTIIVWDRFVNKHIGTQCRRREGKFFGWNRDLPTSWQASEKAEPNFEIT